jgi:alanine dehydrogenase
VPDLLVLGAEEVRAVLDLDRLADVVADGLRALSSGAASVPPRVAAETADGFLASMPGHVPGHGLATKLVSVFPANERVGRPAVQAVVLVFDAATGTPLALLDGTWLTGARTAAAARVAATALARPGASELAVVGAGVQGAAHLDAFARAFDLADVRVASRTPARAEALAERHLKARAVGSYEEAVRGADVVCLCTDSPEPVVDRSWLAPGAHVSSVGSGVEVDAATVAEARVFVESRAVATSPFPTGSRELAGLAPDTVTEVGEVLLGTRPGRTAGDDLTLYKSMGHAVEDVAAAALVLAAAADLGVGTRVRL